MKQLTNLFGCLLIPALVIADDTEIYGTDGIDDDNRVNANVLFIMDTSGSMDGIVQIPNDDYDPDFTYGRNLNPLNPLYEDDFYHDVDDQPNDGHDWSALTYYGDSHSRNCKEERDLLTTEGRAYGRFYQLRSGRWRNLQDGNNGRLRCDYGYTKWLYTGNYMNWYHNYQSQTVGTRIEAVTDVVNALTYSLKDVNLGLMRFDSTSAEGGMIDVPVQDVATSGALIRDKLADYDPSGGTPLSEVLYEAALYYRGENWEFGDNSSPNPSVPESRVGNSGSQYNTPMEASCQKNHIILLTDGEPTIDDSANTEIRQLLSTMDVPSDAGLDTDCSGHGGCLDELAYWLQNSDHSSTLSQGQGITVHTIGGFELEAGEDLLRNTATKGGGNYYEADNTQGLIKALDTIFLRILDSDTTFTAPAVSVNAFNTSEHRDELFYALFRPEDTIKWTGNVKKYKLKENGTVVSQDGKTLAIDTNTGFFADSAKDFWNATDRNDGSDVSQGGFANLLTAAGRNIYTETSSGTLALGSFSSLATQSSLGTANADETDKLKDWVYGIDVDDADGDNNITEDRFSIGDPLHSEPVIVTYGGDDTNPDSTVYFGTNEGFIHGISTDTGKEQFAFVPQALHSIQKDYFENSIGASSKPYGMDGPISTWFYDKNDNNIILNGSTPETDEHVYLYAGMRRGGQNYYGLDITDRSSPEILFKIEGGTGDFTKLGQTWSRMQIAKVKLNGESRFVLFFSGGYDIDQDNNTTKTDDDIGNAVYMVDATTGERLWWASNTGANTNIPEMVNSIPATPALVDHDGDSFVDYFFVADMGGRVFRFDIDNENIGESSFADGGMIASVSDDTVAGNRRFYNKPNISLAKSSTIGDYLTISLGSGHRAHPKNTTAVENRFYVIKDRSPYGKPESYTAITEAPTSLNTFPTGTDAGADKLYNLTDVMLGNIKDPLSNPNYWNMLNNGGGFYVTLSAGGEKVLAESVTFSGAIIFTTFKPSSSTDSTNSCGANTGESRIYALNQKTGEPILELDEDSPGIEASALLSHSGIAPRPVIIYRKGGGKTIAVGTEAIDDCRFEPEKCGPPKCEDDECPNEEVGQSRCEENNCNVTPIYWRQNTKE